MAMMISKFHKLIQSKIVWYIVIGVIVLSFTVFGVSSYVMDGATRGKSQVAGEMFGETISRDAYRQALQGTYIWYILSTGQQPDMREMGDALRERAWQRLVLLHKAAEDKVIVSDQEVVQQIQRIPVFMNQQRVFDKRIYDAILGQIGVSSTQVEAIAREQIAIQKMMYRPAQAALIAPDELERAYHMYSDRMTLDYVVFTAETLNPDVTVTREDAEAYFAENKELFRMPAKVRVSYVEYPVVDFLEQAEIPEGAALQIYNQNLDAYRIETTGDAETVEYKAFEEVEPEITATIAAYSARRLATEAATSLVADIAPKAQNAKPDFKGAAAAAGLTVQTLPTFGPTDELAGIDASAPFKQVALGLRDDAYSSFSDAVVGQESVYVISLEKRYESFLPDFEVVEEKVMAAARSRAAAEAGAVRLMEIRDAVAEAVKNGADFKTAIAPYGVPVQTTEEFDLTAPPAGDYTDALMRAAASAAPNGLCPLVPLEDGMLFASVAQRTTVDAEIGLPAMRDELVSGLTGIRAQRLAAEWQQQLMDEANLKISE